MPQLPSRPGSDQPRQGNRLGYGRKQVDPFYLTKEWRALREQVIREEEVCTDCGREMSTDAAHIIPRKNRPDLALVRSNVTGKCHGCHAKETWRATNRMRAPLAIRCRVVVVSGLPGVGKSTYVQKRATRGDLIVDLDAIFAAISGLSLHDNPDSLLPFACSARDAIYDRLRMESDVRRAWIITSDVAAVAALTVRFNAEHVLLNCEEGERLRRVKERGQAEVTTV